MTLVMLWREIGGDRLWVVSDSRLTSTLYPGSYERLTDKAAKILEVPVTLYASSAGTQVLATRRLGFAYTGSSLVALQAYSAVLPLWTRLTPTEGGNRLPTIGECAAHLSQFVDTYAIETRGKCQCFLVGYEDTSARPEAWIIKPRKSAGQVAITAGQMNMFGSGKDEMTKKLAEWKQHPNRWGNEPVEIIRSHLKADAHLDVGGGVQIGMATKDGFELFFDAQPFVAGVSQCGDSMLGMKYRGFDHHDIINVGPTFTFLRGISR